MRANTVVAGIHGPGAAEGSLVAGQHHIRIGVHDVAGVDVDGDQVGRPSCRRALITGDEEAAGPGDER